ncbi:hypothetical protein TDMWS_15870 [Thermodesulfomicrobium sp. WS]|nr:hypothetical protein TDMWS_15870 [Thermodesulfomicrobium sp. WS]
MAMERWECPCGYVYDPAEGDAEHNIQAGTAFEDLPEDWVCPKCGAEKSYFENSKKSIDPYPACSLVGQAGEARKPWLRHGNTSR